MRLCIESAKPSARPVVNACEMLTAIMGTVIFNSWESLGMVEAQSNACFGNTRRGSLMLDSNLLSV